MDEKNEPVSTREYHSTYEMIGLSRDEMVYQLREACVNEEHVLSIDVKQYKQFGLRKRWNMRIVFKSVISLCIN